MYGRNTLNDKLFHLYYKAYGENSVYDSELMYDKLMILPYNKFQDIVIVGITVQLKISSYHLY